MKLPNPFERVNSGSSDLYKIAYYKTLSGPLGSLKITGTNNSYPFTNFNFTYPRWMDWYMKIGLINYSKFKDARVWIKEIARKNKLDDGFKLDNMIISYN